MGFFDDVGGALQQAASSELGQNLLEQAGVCDCALFTENDTRGCSCLQGPLGDLLGGLDLGPTVENLKTNRGDSNRVAKETVELCTSTVAKGQAPNACPNPWCTQEDT